MSVNHEGKLFRILTNWYRTTSFDNCSLYRKGKEKCNLFHIQNQTHHLSAYKEEMINAKVNITIHHNVIII